MSYAKTIAVVEHTLTSYRCCSLSSLEINMNTSHSRLLLCSYSDTLTALTAIGYDHGGACSIASTPSARNDPC